MSMRETFERKMEGQLDELKVEIEALKRVYSFET